MSTISAIIAQQLNDMCSSSKVFHLCRYQKTQVFFKMYESILIFFTLQHIKTKDSLKDKITIQSLPTMSSGLGCN
jgi:hypothetical protein